jgi:Putative zinc-finger
MTRCSSVTRWLPLYVGGDLDPEKMDRVADHLAGCQSCARKVLELEEARVWLRSAEVPEFDDETLLQLRHAIRRQVENQKQEIDRWAWLRISLRPAALATAAVLLTGALAFSLWSRKPSEVARHEVPPPVVKVEKHPDGEPGGNVATANTQAQRRHQWVGRRVAQTPRAKPRAVERQIVEALPAGTHPVDSTMVRLEIQTADPNIRIIWLTPAEAPAQKESNESKEEFK